MTIRMNSITHSTMPRTTAITTGPDDRRRNDPSAIHATGDTTMHAIHRTPPRHRLRLTAYALVTMAAA
jgi:hypothetical protein